MIYEALTEKRRWHINCIVERRRNLSKIKELKTGASDSKIEKNEGGFVNNE